MTRSSWSTALSALGIGVVSGLRFALGPALVSTAASRGNLLNLEDTPFAAAAFRRVSWVLSLLAAGELVADKSPIIPNRTSPPVLLGRAISGAASGAAISLAERHSGRIGALLGGASAVCAAVVGTRLRVEVSQRPGVPSLLPGLVEDVLAVGLGLLALSGRAVAAPLERRW